MKIDEMTNLFLKMLNDAKIEEARNKYFILTKKVLNYSKEYILIHGNEDVELEEFKKLEMYINKLIEGIPVQYLTNEQEFYGNKFYVDDNVLIPQPDTEILVEEAISIIKNGDKVLDLCTGSGAIGISLKKKFADRIDVIGTDISKEALRVARMNADANRVSVEFVESNMFDKIVENDFDLIVSNPPYIETNVIKTLSKEVQNEPHIALDGGSDGLDFYRIIAKEGKDYLKSGGYLIIEIGFNQRDEVINLLKENDYLDIYSKKDYSGNDRIVVGRRG